MNCRSCARVEELIYRGLCASCTREFRYARYRGWIERRAMKNGRPIPREGLRLFKKKQLKRVES